MIYVVLGMHKSGTTLVSELLHRAGIRMGDDDDVEGDYDEGGFYERSNVAVMNQQMLGFGDPAHYWPAPRAFSFTPTHRARIRAMVRRNEERGGDWGFKDPRTCLTYHLWREELPEHRIIAVFRPLPEVLVHYARAERNLRLPWRVVRTWCDYNERVVQALREAKGGWLALRYGELMSGNEEFQRLERFVGRKLEDRREPGRYRSYSDETATIAAIRRVRRALGLTDPTAIERDFDALRAAQCLQEGRSSST